jgi:hypothetical protein
MASPSDLISSSAAGGILHSLPNNAQAVGAAWLVSSAIFTTYSTTNFLKFEPKESKPLVAKKRRNKRDSAVAVISKVGLSRPTLLTLFRFGGSLLLGLLAHPDLAIVQRIQDTAKSVPAFALPAVFLFVANFCNSISLNRIGIPLTYTSKCGIPLITVILTVLLDGTKALPNSLALLSLLPVALGIAAASWNSPTFETIGFLAAAMSATAQSALNVTSKRAMMKTGVTGAAAQRVMVAVGFVIAITVTLLQPRPNKNSAKDNGIIESAGPPTLLTLLAVTAYHMEYVFSFMFVRLVQPITYGTCDAIRRLCIIITGRLMFGGPPLKIYNILGVAMALLGALSYSVTSSL